MVHRLSNFEINAKWGVNRFPDGQIQFWIEKNEGSTVMTCSIVSSLDLDLFLQIIDTVKLDTVIIKYLYGSRCDKTKAGDRTVAMLPRMIMKAIGNSINDIHSTRYSVWNPHDILARKMMRSIVPIPDGLAEAMSTFDAILFPDESAQERFMEDRWWKDAISGIPNYTCTKKRDQISGSVTQHTVPDITASNVLVLDDLCDGGRTFMDIANDSPNIGNLSMYVTHGVFSNDALPKLRAMYSDVWYAHLVKPSEWIGWEDQE